MKVKKHYEIIGVEEGLGLFKELETLDPISTEEFASNLYEYFDEYKITGRKVTRTLREELRGEVEIAGLAGPMWGGEKDGVPIVRYETAEAYRILSA